MWDYHPTGAVNRYETYLKRMSITRSWGAGHFIRLEEGSWRRGRAKEDSAGVNGNTP